MNLGMVGLFILAVVIMLIGVAGTILPMLPGLPIMWVTAFIYALLAGLERIDRGFLEVFALLTAITSLLGFVVLPRGRLTPGRRGAGRRHLQPKSDVLDESRRLSGPLRR